MVNNVTQRHASSTGNDKIAALDCVAALEQKMMLLLLL